MRSLMKPSNTAVAMLLVLSSALALAADRPDVEVGLEFDGRDWSVGYEACHRELYIVEFVLPQESVCCWSELVTWQFLEGWQGRESPRELTRQFRHRKMIQTPTAKWDIVSEDFDSILYTWKIENDRLVGAYFELTQIIKDRTGLHVLHYATQDQETFSENLSQWVEVFKNAEISG